MPSLALTNTLDELKKESKFYQKGYLMNLEGEKKTSQDLKEKEKEMPQLEHMLLRKSLLEALFFRVEQKSE